jgi:protein-tyrosine-phosphatase
MRVHFICNGNAYRSRMSQAYFDSLNTGIESTSSGVRAGKNLEKNFPYVTSFVDDFLEKQGITPNRDQRPVQLTQEMLEAGDVVVIINDIVLSNLQAAFTAPSQIRIWDISDFDEQTERPDIHDHTAYIFAKIKKNVDELAHELAAKN